MSMLPACTRLTWQDVSRLEARHLDRLDRCIYDNANREKGTTDEKGGTRAHLVLHCAAVSCSVPQLFVLCRVSFDLPPFLEASASCITTNFEARI